MGYYMRFLVTDPGPVDLADLAAALRRANPRYQFEFEPGAGTLSLGGTPIARIEVNTPGDGLFEDELAGLEDQASEGTGVGEAKVADALATTQAIFAVQVLAAASGTDGSLESLDPVWEWLFSTRRGLLQADAEGYYDSEGLIFEVP
jgi:hypothetical protein